MALANCVAFGKKVYRSAKSCPDFRHPKPTKTEIKKMLVLLVGPPGLEPGTNTL